MMSAELIVLSSWHAAAAALIVSQGVLSLRADARGDARSTGRARDVLGTTPRTACSQKRSGRRRSHERTSEAGDPPRSAPAGWQDL